MIKKILLGAFVVTTVIAVFSPASFAEFQSGPCPVMPGKQTKEKFSTEYEGKTVYFCCKGCVNKFTKNPQKYADALK